MAQIKPQQDNVVVQFLPLLKSVGAILLPGNVKPEKTLKARVVAVGPGHYDRGGRGPFIPTTVEVGDIVLVDRQAGQDYCLDINVPRQNKGAEFADGEDNFRVVREDEILAIVDDDPVLDEVADKAVLLEMVWP
jgi:co-chaperonin GroES (HSP10)